MIIDQVDEVEQQDPPTKHKITQKALNDFASTIEAKPNLTSKELLQKFPEFNNDLKVLQSAFDYHATSKSGKYKTVDELNGKFPEFEFTDVKKKDIGGTESISKVQSISPTKWEDNVLNPASQFATSPTQPKEVKPTKAKAPFSESGIFREEGNAIPTISQTPDADRLESHKNPKDNRAGYLWNKLTKGIGSLLAGNSDNFINAMSSVLPPSVLGDSKENVMKQWREQVTPITRDFVEKKIGSKTVTKEQEQKYNDEFLTSAAGGLLQSTPAMLAPKGAKLVAMVTQAQDDALQSINSTKLGKDLPESTKSVFSLGVGIAQGALEKFGFDKIFGKASGAISKKIAGKVFKELVEKSDAPITRELYEQALDTYLKTAKQQLIKGGTKIGKGGAVEFLTGSLQEGSTVFAESLLNSKTGLDVFEPKSWGDQLGRILKSGAQEAVGGLVLGGASYSMSNVDNYIADKVEKAQTPEDIDNLKREVLEQVDKDGTATPEAIDGVVKLVDDYARVKNKIPADVPNKKEVTDKILEREDIEQQIAQKKQEIQNLDPAFQKPAMIEVELLEKRVAELNNEISKVEITPVEDTIESQVKENEDIPIVSETEGKSDVVVDKASNVGGDVGISKPKVGKYDGVTDFEVRTPEQLNVDDVLKRDKPIKLYPEQIVPIDNQYSEKESNWVADRDIVINEGYGSIEIKKGDKLFIRVDNPANGDATSSTSYKVYIKGRSYPLSHFIPETAEHGSLDEPNHFDAITQMKNFDKVISGEIETPQQSKEQRIKIAETLIPNEEFYVAKPYNARSGFESPQKVILKDGKWLRLRNDEWDNTKDYEYNVWGEYADKNELAWDIVSNARVILKDKKSTNLQEQWNKQFDYLTSENKKRVAGKAVEQSLSTKPEINNEGKQEVNAIEETPKWEEVKQKSTTEFREPEKVKEILEVELPDKNVEAEYTDVIEGKTKLDKVKYIQRDAKRNHKLLELLINCLTK